MARKTPRTTTTEFDATFATLRGILQRQATGLASPSTRLAIVRSPLPPSRTAPAAAVRRRGQRRKHYVSYDLMPVYAMPELLEKLSPELRERMQGKSCFNFTTIAPAQAKELSAVTKAGIAAFPKIELPWAR